MSNESVVFLTCSVLLPSLYPGTSLPPSHSRILEIANCRQSFPVPTRSSLGDGHSLLCSTSIIHPGCWGRGTVLNGYVPQHNSPTTHNSYANFNVVAIGGGLLGGHEITVLLSGVGGLIKEIRAPDNGGTCL